MFAQKMKKMSFLVGIQATFMLMLLALYCSTAAAQTTGTILGQVTDPSGAAVPNAALEAENVGTGLMRSGVTDSLGSYVIPALPLGAYKVSVKASGFKTFVQTGITLQLNQNARVDAQLQLGTATETVEVTGEAVKVDTASSTLGATMSTRQILDLPLSGRNALGLAQMLPGVGRANIQTIVVGYRGGDPMINVSGARGTGNSLLLDGTVLVAGMTNNGLNISNPDALDEFRILRNSYSAEYGRAEGAIFLAVTKAGTNDVHGSVWEFLRNDALNARNFFAPGKPVLRQNQFGFALGGPVILPGYNGRNRTFFFGSYEGLRIRQQTFNVGYPPTAAHRAGDFSAIAKPIIDPVTGVQFPGNIIPTDRLDPLAVGMLQYVQLPNQPGGFLSELRSLPQAGNQFNVKVDQLFGASDRVSFRYYRNQYVNSKSYGGISDVLVGSGRDNTKSFSAVYTHVFSPILLNELRGSYTRLEYLAFGAPAAKDPPELGALYPGNGSYPQVPGVNVSGYMSVGSGIPFQECDLYWQLDDKLTWIRGRHHITAGFRGLLARHCNLVDLFTSGSFTFSGIFTGNAMADYMLGRPSFLTHYAGSLIDDAKRFEYQPFVQDDIKVTRKLTMNLGLRYEVDPPWYQRHGRAAAIRYGFQSTRFPAAPPGLAFQGDPGIPRGMYPTDKNNFGPRFGLAWDPTGNGRTAIRTGFGVFYQNVPENLSAFATNDEPFVLTLGFTPYSFSDPYQGQVMPFPYDFSANPQFAYPMEVLGTSPDMRSGYLYQYNLNIQHQFGQDLVVTVGYVGNTGHKLYQLREVNMAVYGPGATAANAQQRRPYYPQYYAGFDTVWSDANYNYNSLQVEVQKRSSRGYSYQVAYTYSKTIDDSSVSSGFFAGSSVQDPNNYGKANRAMSDFDQRHMLSVNGTWELPFLQNKGALTSALGGWELSGLVRVTSGLPINVISGADYALIGGGRHVGPQRPNLVGDPHLDPNRSHNELVAQYFNTAAFARPADGQFGNLGRNALIGPGFAKTDLGIIKRFSLPKERLGKIQFRAEVFNLFNNVNFTNPNATRTSPAFGKLQAASDARIVQLGLKWEF
ncbi:MAG: TonB-dependent receptor [Acidobacteria bacterium]|nr:TonB-dependent receptor [Acidobacteriota bacterium]